MRLERTFLPGPSGGRLSRIEVAAGCALAAVVALVAFAGALWAAAGVETKGIEGTWRAERHGKGWQVETRARSGRDHIHQSHWLGLDASEDDLAARLEAEALVRFFEGDGVRHTVRRDAGSFELIRDSDRRGEVRGSFRFVSSAEFARAMADLGYPDLSDWDGLRCALLDLTVAFASDLADLGYGGLPFERLLEMRIHDVDAEFVRAIKALGYVEVPAKRLIEMRIHDVTPAYAEGHARGRLGRSGGRAPGRDADSRRHSRVRRGDG